MRAVSRANFLFLSVMVLTVNGWAFTLGSQSNPNLHGWPNPGVQFEVNTANCPGNVDLVAITNDALVVWNSVATSSLNVSYVGTTTANSFGSPVVIYCETNFQSVSGLDQNFATGSTSFVYGGDDAIYAAVIRINASGGSANIGNISGTQARIIMAHEIGHAIGLGHSSTSNALMYYNSGSRTTLSLAQDDIDGISYLYPANLGNSGYGGCGLVKSPPTPKGGPWLPVTFFLFMLPVFTYWKLRRASS